MAYFERTGILLIADISGYTEYLTAEELAHAEGIISRLLEATIGAAGDGLKVAKLEGDAIFFVGEDAKVGAEVLRAAIERMFEGFHACRAEVTATNQCRCQGCLTAAKLGVKFVAHRGRFGEHVIHGMHELIGADVIVVHRLLKNTVGLRQYAAFTAPLVEAWGNQVPAGGVRHVDQYEHIGRVELWVWDLGAGAPGGPGSDSRIPFESTGGQS